jgi:hypothetical protein
MSLHGHGNLPTNYEEIETDRENKTMPSTNIDIETNYISNS